MPRSLSCFKKRRFRGNQHDEVSKEDDKPETCDVIDSEARPPAATPISSISSSSKKKLSSPALKELFKSDIVSMLNAGYQLIDIELLSSAICNSTSCKQCSNSMCLSVHEDVPKRRGLSATLMMKCAMCDYSCVFKTSKATDNGPEVNVRFVYGMRTIGRGQKPAKMLCSVMGLPSPPTKFGPINKVLGKVLQTTAEASMKVAVEEAVRDNVEEDSPRDLVCAIDGSW